MVKLTQGGPRDWPKKLYSKNFQYKIWLKLKFIMVEMIEITICDHISLYRLNIDIVIESWLFSARANVNIFRLLRKRFTSSEIIFGGVKFVILFCLQLEDIVCDKGAKARGQKDISRGQERLKTQRFLYFIKYFLSPPKFDYFFKTQNSRHSTDKKTSREILRNLKVRPLP